MNTKLIDIQNLSKTTPVAQHTTRPFRLLIKPIGPVCNLDCEYCFYLDKEKLYPKRHSFRMSDETLKTLTKQYIDAQPEGMPTLNFAWQGGEPTLLGVEFFRKALQYQKEFARPGMTITNAMQTNGTLIDDEWGEFLSENKFLVGISIDGPMKLHDRLRKTKTGEGSFNQVKRGVEFLRKYNVEHNFLCVINSHNGEHPTKVYDTLKRLGAEFIQFIPIVEHDHFEVAKPGKPKRVKISKNSVKPTQFGKFLNAVFDEWSKKDIGKVFIRNFEDVIAKMANAPSSMCIHAPVCGRNLAVEHDGTVYSCDHFVFPQFKQSNLTETPLHEIVESEQQVSFGTDKQATLTDACKQCEYLKLCHGGCPAHRINDIGERDMKHNYLCEGYKIYYKHTAARFFDIAKRL